MKKLLCVLMFGMMFGQTKLETREYILPSNTLNYDIINDRYVHTLNIEDIRDLTGSQSNLYIIRPYMDLSICSYQWVQFYDANENYGVSYSSSAPHPFMWNNTSPVDEFILNNINGSEFNIKFYNNNCDGDIVLLITAEFPQEDTGYIEDGFDYCLHTGANLVSSPCRDEVAIESAIPSDILQNITGIITEGGAASNIGGNWVGSLNGLGGGKGYWVISDIDGCFNYTCSEN